MAVCVKVVIDELINKIDKPYDYYVPDVLIPYAKIGVRVIVPFSRSNMRKKALVLEVFERDDINGLKSLITVVDDAPIIDGIQLDLLELLKRRYFVSYYRALKTIVPRGIDFEVKEKYILTCAVEPRFSEFFDYFNKSKGSFSRTELSVELRKMFDELIMSGAIVKDVTSKARIGDRTERRLRRKISVSDIEELLTRNDRKYVKQNELLSVFLDYSDLSYKDAVYYSGCSDSTVNTLVKNGYIESYKEIIARDPYKEIIRKQDMTPVHLNEEQSTIYQEILKELSYYKVHLIHGVTGSGKTLLYIALIDQVVQCNKSVIFMVPEISLTPQMLERFYNRYGESVAVVHSGLSVGERADEWKKIRSGRAKVIVGTRSAVFSPAVNLGMIIIDEEHESSYKSESTPKYHARDISKFICKKTNIPLILGSATPSVESRYYAYKDIYNYHILKHRFNNNPLPLAEIIDMKNSETEGEQSFLSSRLREEIEINLAKKEQIILFLNRRGANTLVGCRSCGHVEKCPNCGIALTYHSVNNRCMCHYCGYNIKMYSECPSCNSKHIKRLGAGTQLVSSELSQLFPDAKLLRMDFDTVSSYIEHGRKLNSFKNGEYDIMLGTQMVAKGLDFPNVTLVGILNADISLHVDDFRANERTFSLLTQVCGRSGRAGKEGRALIQTYSPDYEVIRFAKSQNYDRYFDFEINFRKAMNYPPFCDLILFTVTSATESGAYNSIMELYSFLNMLSKTDYSDIPIRLLYPTVPKIAKFNGKYRYNLVIKTKINNKLYDLLNSVCDKFDDKSDDISINVNPMNNI